MARTSRSSWVAGSAWTATALYDDAEIGKAVTADGGHGPLTRARRSATASPKREERYEREA